MYLTFFNTRKKPPQLTIEEYLFNMVTAIKTSDFKYPRITIKKDNVDKFALAHADLNWAKIPEPPKWDISEIHNHYTTFNIPKASGGVRRIDAPDNELKIYLTHLKYYFEYNLNIQTHDAAHAYVKERSVITALNEHQKNESNWFLKLDLKSFFPSHNLEYVIKCLENIYPTALLLKNEEYRKDLTNALQYAFLDDQLPQGTPLSPTLTNICMVGIDYQIQHRLWELKNNYIYTRYADDMLISSKYNFKYKDIVNEIIKIFDANNCPFHLNQDKTRYGSRAGKNWNLGVMLNKDNKLTIGHENNQKFRAEIFQFIMDYKSGTQFSYEHKSSLLGKINWYHMVEPDYIDYTIKRYNQKYHVDILDILKH